MTQIAVKQQEILTYDRKHWEILLETIVDRIGVNQLLEHILYVLEQRVNDPKTTLRASIENLGAANPEAVVVPRELFYHEERYVRGLERLAAAVLLFHRGGPWTDADRQAWSALTGASDATTKSLCDFARKVNAHDQTR